MWIAAIGIDRYRAWGKLHNAVSDARGALKLFLQLGFEQACEPLLDDAATGDALRSLVTDDLAILRPEDSLVVFFAGHGHTITRTFPGANSVKNKKGYIIPIDGDLPGGRVGTWLRLDSWLGDITHLPVKHLLVVLDTCHSGIALDPAVPVVRWRGSGADLPRSLVELRGRRSRRIITSARDDQLAMDSGPVPGHSLFTSCLIEALTGGLVAASGESWATGTEIGSYVQRRVIDLSNSMQSPEFGALELDERGELIVRLEAMNHRPPKDVDPGFSLPDVRLGQEISMGSNTQSKRHRPRSGRTGRSLHLIAVVGILGTLLSTAAIIRLSNVGASTLQVVRQIDEQNSTHDPASTVAPSTDVSTAISKAPTSLPVDGMVSSPVDEALDRREAWLAGPVFGADNTATRGERVRIKRTERGYQVWIEKDLGFICSLEFDDSGDPRALVGCAADSPFWKVVPARISMKCLTDVRKRHARCSAPYRLQGSNHYSTDAEFVLYRNLNPR